MFTNKQETSTKIIAPHIDRRVQRTRQLLQDALLLLIVERGYEAIAIQDITERANLGRTTFYLHYQDKEELLKASVKALLQELQFEVEPSDEEACPYLERCVRIFQHVAQRQQLYQALLKETGPVNIGNLLQSYFIDLFHRHILQLRLLGDFSKTAGEIVAAHAAGSLFGLISWWLSQGGSPSAENMGATYFQLMSKGCENIQLP